MAAARYTFVKRAFFNPASTLQGSYVLAHVESSRNGEHAWGSNIVTVADCHRTISIEFCIGNEQYRRISVAKIDLLINVLSAFRDALGREIDLIEKAK
jgi:hypothetical protein